MHLVKEGTVLASDSRSHEKFIHGIKVLMAKNHNDNLSEETKKGMLEKAEQGMWPSCAPFGYVNVDGENGKKIIIPNPESALVIEKIFEWYVSGLYSIKQVEKKLKEARFVVDGKQINRPHSSVGKMLRNPIYYGDFLWKGKLYKGSHEPIINKEQWDAAQDLLDTRLGNRRKKSKHNFAFSGLITCSICGRSLIGELKKGKYIYYRCGGRQLNCKTIPYAREEVFEEKISELLKHLRFEPEVLDWISKALKETRKDQREEHQKAVDRLQKEYNQLDSRIEQMYEDKLDGTISQAFFDKKSGEWRNRQNTILEKIHQHQTESQSFIEEGIKLLELASNAYSMFVKQPAREKRRLLNFMLSNSVWDGKELVVEFKQPFDLFIKTPCELEPCEVAEGAETTKYEKWLPRQDSNLRQAG